MLGELSLKINTVGIGYSVTEFFCSVDIYTYILMYF